MPYLKVSVLMSDRLQDELLEWCSERQEGGIARFREAFEWLARRQRDLRGHRDPLPWELTLYNLQILGHVEVDWKERCWAVSPTVVTVLDNSGGNALMVGARPRSLVRRLDTLESDLDAQVRTLAARVELLPPVEQPQAPAARFLTAPSDEILGELCQLLEVRFEHRVAAKLRDLLPTLDSYLVAGECKAAPPGVEACRFRLGNMPEWKDVDADDAPGAYEYQGGYGPRRYHFVDELGRYEGDKGIVMYAELRRVGDQAIFYSSTRAEMMVPALIRLPMLAARCAVLRTGLLPRFSRDTINGVPITLGPINLYANVPTETYVAICKATGQDPSRGLLQ